MTASLWLDAHADVSPEAFLGSALAQAVRQLVNRELDARLTPVSDVAKSPWMTPPAASRITRVPVKTIRAWVRDGRIVKRLKNRSADPRQQKYLVNVNEVVAAAEQVWTDAPSHGGDSSIQERARQILATRAVKGR